jgi:glucose 1-dehydrogenase
MQQASESALDSTALSARRKDVSGYMGILRDRVMVITGGSRGFGFAVAKAAAAEGARLVIASRGEEAVAAAVGELRTRGAEATGMACDVSDLEQVEALGEHATRAFGSFDIWVNNAGYAGPYGPAMHIAPPAFLRVISTNVIGSYHGSLVALRSFLPAGQGKLINVLGRGSDGKPEAMQTAYAASKTWLRSFTIGLAKAYKDTGVGIYAINPGMMTTDFLTDLQAVSGYEKRLHVMPAIIRMWAKPPEAPAQKVVWLASPATDGKTGLEVREMSAGGMLRGVLSEGLSRILRRPLPHVDVQIASLPAALPLPNRRGPALGEKWSGGRS